MSINSLKSNQEEVSEAIILAASKGAQMGNLTSNQPKVMISIRNKTILEHVIDLYRSHDINNIHVVRGYMKDSINFDDINYIDNDNYESTSELYSFKKALEGVNHNLFCSFGDVLFKPYLLQLLDSEDDEIMIIVDTNWQDSVNKDREADYVICSDAFSKSNSQRRVYLESAGEDLDINMIHGEWTGLIKFKSRIIPEIKNELLHLSQDEEFNKLKMYNFLNHLLDIGKNIRVIYTAGNWLDIDILEDVIKANSFINVLLNPGPVNMSSGVKNRMISEDFCHREREFADLVKEVNLNLKTIYPNMEEYDSVILTSSGTGAVEAMLTSFIHDDKSLVLANGVYGERIETILSNQNKDFYTLNFGWLNPIDEKIVEDYLVDHKEIKNLIMVHHETTTGRLNNLSKVGKLCKNHNINLYLDGVSSFGAEEILANQINLKAVAASANKCLHAAPGISFVLAHKDQWEMRQKPPLGVYFDLHKYYKMQTDNGFSPFTQATHLVVAFHEAIGEFIENGGWIHRNQLFKKRADLIYESLKRFGIEPLIPLADFSSVLRSYKLPQDTQYSDLHKFMKANGYIIYQGQGRFEDEIFRISTMGNIEESEISILCGLFEDFFTNYG